MVHKKGEISVSTFVNLAKMLLAVGFIGVLLFFMVFTHNSQHTLYSEQEARELWNKMRYPPMLLKEDYRGYPELVINWSKAKGTTAIDCKRTGNKEGCIVVAPHNYCLQISCGSPPLDGQSVRLGDSGLCDKPQDPKSGIKKYSDVVPVYDPDTGKTIACTVTATLDMRA